MDDKELESILFQREVPSAPDDLAANILRQTEHMPQASHAQKQTDIWAILSSSINRALTWFMQPRMQTVRVSVCAALVATLLVVQFVPMNSTVEGQYSSFADEEYQYLYYGDFYFEELTLELNEQRHANEMV